jgi:hypothetical protein
MVAKVALLWGPLKVSLFAAGILYFVHVLVTYTNSDQDPRPVLDRRNLVESSGQLLAWAGNAALAVSVKLGRPLFDMLCEASADLGEWVLSRPPGRVLVRAANAIQTRERLKCNYESTVEKL